jgi:NAD(P)-dependent dehydrogenase (short-subunit alcohol dehydrogenase family)
MPTTTRAILSGHSRGLGAAVAAELLARGIPVLGLARHPNADLAQRFPEALQQVALDLADTAALARWLAGDALATYLAGARTVLLINNAGLLQPVGPLGTQDAAAIVRAVGVNLTAPLLLSNALAAACAGGVECRILHVSSGAARSAYAGWSVYGATKAALDQHARAVALEGAPHLSICSLAPGVIDTAMQAEVRASTLAQFPQRARFEALKQDGRLLRPEACAERLVVHLLGADFGRQPVADLRELTPTVLPPAVDGDPAPR